jgi:hypothetical protein
MYLFLPYGAESMMWLVGWTAEHTAAGAIRASREGPRPNSYMHVLRHYLKGRQSSRARTSKFYIVAYLKFSLLCVNGVPFKKQDIWSKVNELQLCVSFYYYIK